jgi:hypothetical protein
VIGYIDFVQKVLLVALAERPRHSPLMVWQLAGELGFRVNGQPPEVANPVILNLDHVLRDLAPHGLVDYGSDGHTVGYPLGAIRFRNEPLTSVWRELRAGYITPEDEEFLVALARLSEQPGEDRADVAEVDAKDVFANLGWEWDSDRPVTIIGHLKERFFVEGRMYGGPSIMLRPTYAGLVRAYDDTGAILREAEDHLHMHRLRAAGCIAAVELERRLKAIAPPPVVSNRRDPQLEDYNKSAFDNGVIDQATWTLVTNLAVTRKRCVHVLDREPEHDEVRDLIDGVEGILRRYPILKGIKP